MIGVSVTSTDLADLAVAIRYEQDGQVLRRDLARNLRVAVAPAVTQAKASIMSMPGGGLHPGGSLRAAIARQVSTQVSLTTRSAKVKVRVGRRGMPRGFRNAPKAVQLAAGWRHPVYGRKQVWVAQLGKPGWFDNPMRSHREQYRAAVEAAVRECADRIARKV